VTVAPKKALGPHFLVDQNILGVIGRMSALASADVVLEVGPGLGVPTRYLAERVARVHSIELDRSLEQHLRDALVGVSNVDLVWGDALTVAVDDLEPQPGKLVANLPYNVATPLVVETLEHASSIQLWCVMVQREVADRFFAEPRTKAYGAVSVLVQLSARRTGFHAVSPHVFRPPPRVQSALVAFERSPIAPIASVRPVVEAAFAHRRKTAANAIAHAGLAPREQIVEALASIGHPPNARAEELTPDEFVALAEALR
jgi:16S rRNA (adenine1518-N6/adenine1519-N6)-dimethyltransferase